MTTASELAARLGVPLRTVQHWCATGRIAGARKLGRDWIIPADAVISPPRPPGDPT